MKTAFIILTALLINNSICGQGQDSVKTGFTNENKNIVDVNESRYTFLNGINFDFKGEDQTKYVGHFNIFVPAKDKNRLAINTGLLKITYMPKDSIITSQVDNILIQPLDVIDGVGDTYNRQYNRYSAHTTVSSFSLYVQPMYLIFPDVGTANIYLHGHLELLMSKYTTITKIKTIQTEEVTVAEGDEIPSGFIRLLAPQVSKTIDLNTGNFGIGTTVDFNFKDNCLLFLQGTVGFSLNHANNFPTIDNEGHYNIATSGRSEKFYLVRTYFQYFTSKATQLVIGTDIRGYFPKETPYTSIYAGINLGLAEIFNSGKEKERNAR
jgi:hypothetical protein